MKFPNVIGKKDLMNAAIIGSVAGLAGVIFFIVLLSSMNSSQTQQAVDTKDEEIIPVSSENKKENEATPPVEFFANQHGVFSSFQSATDFIAGFSSLNTSSIVEIDGNFYVWSAITSIKEEIVIADEPSSFAKSFTLSSESCTNPNIQSLPEYLKSNDPSKYYFEAGKVPDNIPEDWQSITSALSTLSGDLSIVRLHLITHYYSKNDCLKIKL